MSPRAAASRRNMPACRRSRTATEIADSRCLASPATSSSTRSRARPSRSRSSAASITESAFPSSRNWTSKERGSIPCTHSLARSRTTQARPATSTGTSKSSLLDAMDASCAAYGRRSHPKIPGSSKPSSRSSSRGLGLQLYLGLVADLQPSGLEQLLVEAECKYAASGRHRVRGEIDAIQRPTHSTLFKPAEVICDVLRDVDHRQAGSKLRSKIAHGSGESHGLAM